MGCDIHYVIEQKDKKLGWVGVFGTDVPMMCTPWEVRQRMPAFRFKSRNYTFFGALAGVRTDGPDPLGLPEDASHMSKMYAKYWGCDGHSHSYCSLRDFITAYLKSNNHGIVEMVKEKLEGSDPVDQFAEQQLDIYASDLDEYRVVFWFDN